MYDRTTVQGATFDMRGQLYRSFRKFAQNIRNNNKGPQLTMRVDRFASCRNIVSRFQPRQFFPLPPSPPHILVPKSPLRNSSTATAEEFYHSSY